MPKQYGFLLDINRCVGCKACELACKSENQTPVRVRWRSVSPNSPESYLSLSCNHCESPECFRVCPNRAYSKRRDGIVVIDSDRCDGCRTCVNACPFKAPQYDPETHKVSKCNLCVSRLEKGLSPACVNACHTGALKIADLSEGVRNGTVAEVPGFAEIRLTRPSIRFYPLKEKKRYWNKGKASE
ncbi:4Fe-4S dicluster domain-containing protein [Desulfosporosinus youngiae]|uniref:Fe-S-cluster-containing hydrogenase subunit n=1 Tax=Desulfosporosinus youngiae DSM 17734 TaxID=768710 RepID=H5Y5N1_9FIRM|nr:4Fe-4S dicluster domain-containing protein [Desulfosporosinus youngiae]EHQ90618.1 Fe-S-cluster-containing hydrogenase subunit [Desulfosporosinus youngiae DSM 17734]